MVPHQKYEVPFTIVNIGKTAFEWFWTMYVDKISGMFDIIVDTSEDILQAGETLHTKMIVIPLIKSQLQPHKIYLKV
jgi:hypothetical protein